MPQDDPFLAEARRQAQSGGAADDPFLAEARRQAGPAELPRAAPIQAAAPPSPVERLGPEAVAEHRRRAMFGEGPTRLRQAVAAGLEAGAVSLGGPALGPLLSTLHPEETRGVAKAVAIDLPVGLAHFVSAPIRAVTAPQSVEEARSPLVRGALMARSGQYIDLEEGVRAALERQATRDAGGHSPTPQGVLAETLRGLVTMGYDAERAAIEAETPEDKARAITNLALLGGLTALDAGAKRPTRTPAPAVPKPSIRQRVADAINPAGAAERRAAQRAAETDPLTGVGNRRAFDRATATPDPNTEVVAFDINNLKAANDVLGHEVGDQAISQASAALARAAAESGVPERVFRLGGDEFVMVVPAGRGQAVRQLAERIYGERPAGEYQVSISGNVGRTYADADAGLQAAKQARKGAGGSARSVESAPKGIVRMPTENVIADPARFQFKELGTEGVSGELKGVQRFNEQLAGVVSVWRDPANGQVYVVNGHHRLELARRTGQPTLNVQFLDAPTAEAARAEGAYINIAEGRGTATDVAKFLRDMRATPDDLAARGVSIKGDVARDGMSLSRLAPDVFDQVATAQVPQGWGVAIGQLLDDPVLQREALAAVRGSGKRLTQVEVAEVARQVRDAGTEALTQENLFGTETERRGLFIQRAQLAAAVRKRLATDKRLFGYVAKEGRAQDLSRAGGTTIDVEAARTLAEGSARAEEIFERLYTRSGPLADLINEGARRVARGEKPGAIVADIYPAIGDAVGRELAAAQPGPRPDVGERPVPQGARSLADEIAEGETGEATRVADSQDQTQGGMFSPGRSSRASEIRPTESAADRPLVDDISARRVGMPDDLKNDINLLGEERAWQRAVTTAGADVVIDKLGIAGRVIEGAQDPVNGVGKRGMALVEHEMEGHTVQRWYRGTELSAGKSRPALELRGEPEGPAQGAMFGERAGTPASRSLAEAERAARGELETLRQRFAHETDPTKRASIARDITEREKLVNRDQAIGAEELRAEAATRGPAEPGLPEQMALLSPDVPAGYKAKLRDLGAAPSKAVVAETQTLLEISRGLAEAVGVPLHQGRFRAGQRKAAGVFFPHAEATRVLRYDKLDTVAHEVGHFISKKYLRNPTMRSANFRGQGRTPVLLPKQAARELVQMGRDLYGSRKPAGGYGEEGIAEWVSFYVTEPHTLAQKAPTFTAWMTDLLRGEPLLRSALDQSREKFATYQQQPAAQRFDNMISVGERQMLSPTMRDYMRVVWDDTYDVQAMVRELGGSKSVAADAGVLARLSRGVWGEAAEWLERGVREVGSADTRLNPGIVQAFEPFMRSGRAQELRRYLDAESALERWENGIDPGFTKADAEAIATAGRENPQLVAAAEAAWAHSRALLEARRDAGLLTPEQFDQIVAKNKRRVGFYRVFDPTETASPRGGGRGSLGSAGLKRQTGSARRVVDPIEAIIRDTYLTAKKIRQEQATRALIDQSLATEGGAKVIEEVPAPQRAVTINVERLTQQLRDLGLVYEGVDKSGQVFTARIGGAGGAELEGLLRSFEDARVAGGAEAKDLVVPVLIEGERKWFQIKDRPLYDALVGMGPVEMSLWQQVLSFPKRLLQTGATTTLEFGFGNLARDIVAQSAMSRAPWRPPLWRHVEGLYHILKKDPVYQRFRLHGADQASMGGVDRGNLQLSSRRLFGYFSTARQAWLDRGMAWSRATSVQKLRYLAGDLERVILSPFEAVRAIKEMSETMGRVGEFAAVERQAVGRGASGTEAATEAALSARDVGIDFQQLGSATRQVNHGIAFFGAFMRGWAQLAREVKQRPHVVIPRLVAEITVPSLALYYLQRDDPVYRDMPAWKRDLFWIYVQRGADQGEGWDGYGSGKPEHVWMFPKPFELGLLFGTLPERAAEWADGRNPEPGRAMAEALRRAVTPPHIPTVAVPIVENFANRSTFRDRPIVPRGRENLAPAEQVAPRTGETARLLGEALGYSPAKLENLIRGYTGGAGMYVVSGTNALIRKGRELTGQPPLKPPELDEEDPLVDVPGLRRFLSRIPGDDAESVARLYRRYEEGERHRLTWRAMLREGRASEATAYLQRHRDAIVSVATRDETNGQPGALRAAHEAMTELQKVKRQLQVAGASAEERRRLMDVGRRLAAAIGGAR